jgi:hypothetical protein
MRTRTTCADRGHALITGFAGRPAKILMICMR